MDNAKGQLQKNAARRTSLAANRAAPRGGTTVNTITAVVFFGLFALGIWWLMKSIGETGQQYTQAMVQTQHKATSIKCQTNLRTIGQNMQIYAINNETYPPSLEALEQWSGSTELFRCPAPDGQKYVYIPGQNGSMSPQNILVYEREAVHDGRCNVLRLNGQIESLTPEELELAVVRTLAGLR